MPFNLRSLATLVVALLLTSAVSAADGVAPPGVSMVEASAALAGSDVPGIDEGAAVRDRLRVIQEVLESGVPKAAEQELEWLIRRIDALLMRGSVVWPASYQRDGELWVPVKADAVTVHRGIPEILPRPNREGRREGVEEVLVEARRIDWLPLERTRTLLTDALQSVLGQGSVPTESRERVSEALGGIRQTVRLKDPVIEAYSAVKTVLAGGDAWQRDGRNDLRQAADGLSAADPADPVARELGNLAEAAAPDVGRLAVVAGQLRGRIAARQTAEGTRAGTPQPVGKATQEGRGTGGGQPRPATAVGDIGQ